MSCVKVLFRYHFKVFFRKCLMTNLTVLKRCFKLSVTERYINTTNGGDDLKGKFPLEHAIANGQFERVKQLIDAGADVNSKQMNGFTPLAAASYGGNIDCTELLITSGADVNCKDVNYLPPLHAVIHGANHIDCMKFLLKSGADVNYKFNGLTPLYDTLINGNVECMKLLIQSGADVNYKLDTGETMLHAASCLGRYRCLKVLINAGADVNSTTEYGDTPLMYAAGVIAPSEISEIVGLREICVEVLLHEGAKINIVNKENGNAAQMHVYCQSSMNRGYNSRIIQVLFAAGEKIELCEGSDLSKDLSKNSDFAEFSQRELKPCLKHRLRDKIRKHLLDQNEHENLFHQVQKLGLPSPIARFLVYNVRLRTR